MGRNDLLEKLLPSKKEDIHSKRRGKSRKKEFVSVMPKNKRKSIKETYDKQEDKPSRRKKNRKRR